MSECRSECDSCFNKNFCTRCRAGFYLHLGKCQEYCPDGLVRSDTQRECVSSECLQLRFIKHMDQAQGLPFMDLCSPCIYPLLARWGSPNKPDFGMKPETCLCVTFGLCVKRCTDVLLTSQGVLQSVSRV